MRNRTVVIESDDFVLGGGFSEGADLPCCSPCVKQDPGVQWHLDKRDLTRRGLSESSLHCLGGPSNSAAD